MTMETERFSQIEQLFHEALKLTPERRRPFLAERAPHDSELRAMVEKLLAAEAAERNSRVIESLLSSDPDVPAPPMPASGQWIGPYRLLRELGRGGAGVVFEAEQANPRRRVALKLLYSARPSDAAHAEELVHEADILARLNHPAIATVYAAGYAETGHPYFVMELVEGQRLDKYVRRRPRAERLQIFLKICDAIEYAHRNQVIHRDLKPSNVMVKEVEAWPGTPPEHAPGPIVKILDFGLARVADRDATLTALTGALKGWGTLPYMSPEQRRGKPVDGRTDVYALGAILFKLLTDELPYPVEGLSFPEAWYHIEHGTPLRPSKLDPALRGDLEAIVLTAMADEPTHRYDSPAELAGDVRHYLSDRPITRRPPGTLYELRKFARRNRAFVTAVLATMLGLAGATIGIYQSYVAATRAKSERQKEAEIKNLLVWYLTAQKPAEDGDEEKIWNVESRAPLELQRRLAYELLMQGRADQAERDYAQLVTVTEWAMPKGNWYIAQLKGEHGECLLQMKRFEEAELELLTSYRGLRAALGERHNLTLEAIKRLVRMYRDWGKPDKAASWNAQLETVTPPPEPPPTASPETPPVPDSEEQRPLGSETQPLPDGETQTAPDAKVQAPPAGDSPP